MFCPWPSDPRTHAGHFGAKIASMKSNLEDTTENEGEREKFVLDAKSVLSEILPPELLLTVLIQAG